ncbi:MAG: hypothetical protein LKH74_00135 [Levilactobacillus sp.]|jgi:hypothetical protein|uniref:hypothetical protein n=1 Tax=Levilactobacillus sp. TaxID=2767919 RepID=UPI00258C9190|nr:hypothetical protein [Levilactobacillus sp.]MCH4123547.1 hypothetical protein [Levilactobacillus sp.]MCI1552315.1 hypothetical protein [Levilactobacillus sp.]MCI1606137.1 hypothetical protein [Levilactobacillus sp.]
MNKNILMVSLATVSLGLGLSATPVTANAKVYSTLPKVLRGNWKKHIGWEHANGKRWERAYTYVGYKHSFWTGMTGSDTYPETVRYVIGKGHGIYKVHTKTTIGGTQYHIVTMKRTKKSLRLTRYWGGKKSLARYTSHHKAIE